LPSRDQSRIRAGLYNEILLTNSVEILEIAREISERCVAVGRERELAPFDEPRGRSVVASR
jgi:hypothetical protein